jgi:hypothetical protein
LEASNLAVDRNALLRRFALPISAFSRLSDLPCQTLSQKVGGPQYGHDRRFPDLIDNGELYTALLNVHHARGGITLRVDLLGFSILHNFSRQAG